MSKTKPKLNNLKRVSLQQTSVFIFSGIAAILLMALFTHVNTDCSFSVQNNTNGACTQLNKAGVYGAYIADILFAAFGYLAYLIPVALVLVGIMAFRFPTKSPTAIVNEGGINTFLSIIGFLFTLFAGSGLATLLWPDVDLYYRGGGLLGKGVVNIINKEFGDYGSALLLLSLFFAGITLLVDIKWALVADIIGKYLIRFFDYIIDYGNITKKEVSDMIEKELKPNKSLNSSKQTKDPMTSNPFEKWAVLVASFSKKIKTLFEWVLSKLRLLIPSAEPALIPAYENTGDALIQPRLNVPSDVDLSPAKAKAPVHYREEASSESIYSSELSTPELSPDPPTVKGTVKKAVAEPTSTPTQEASPAPIIRQPEKPVAEQKILNAISPKNTLEKMRSFFNPSTHLPSVDLLDKPPANQHHYSEEHLKTMANRLVESLGHYNIKEAIVENYYPGPVITRYEIQLKAGTKVSKVAAIVKDLARTLGVPSVRLVEVIPGTTNIGIEVPNDTRNLVTIREIIESDKFQNKESKLAIVLGSDIAGQGVVVDLASMPHCLVAGTTGSGKSVGVNAMLLSILYKAEAKDVRLILIDPKMLELSIYEDIPHLLTPVVTDMKDAANSLRWCVAEMERRYLLMSKLKVRNVAGFNEKVRKAAERGDPIIDPLYDPTKTLDVTPKALEPLPFIVIVIDEFADMMMVVGKKVEELIARLAQKARAAGIHLVLATQRPSVDVITGLIKANIPTRIAFQVTSTTDSRTILDQMGAEQLLGKGDMLYLPPGMSMPQRVHGAFVSDDEVNNVVTYIRENQGEPDYLDEVLKEPLSGDVAIPGLEPVKDAKSELDPLYDEAIAVITESRRASISYLQRRLKVGYNRAARMIENMEESGVVSAVQSNGTREVLAPPPVKE